MLWLFILRGLCGRACGSGRCDCFDNASFINRRIQMKSCAAWEDTIYSALHVFSATIGCFFDCHWMGEPNKLYMHPDVDVRSYDSA